MGAIQADHRGLTIFSLEDEPETIAGSLDSLEFEGHSIERCKSVDEARRVLRERQVNLVLLDEHVSGDDDAGSKLITELKTGALGTCNRNVPFGFVTASRAWVNVAAVAALPGYLGVEIKGSDLTRALEEWASSLLDDDEEVEPAPLRRVPLHIDGIEASAGDADLLLTIPAWDPHDQVRYAAADLPTEMRHDLESLAERWFIARMSLDELDPAKIVIRDWEPQEPLGDDDGLA